MDQTIVPAGEDEFFKLFQFLLAGVGQRIFGSDLPPLNPDVAESCAGSGLVSSSTCDAVCEYCEYVVPAVCENPFELDATVPSDNSITFFNVPTLGQAVTDPTGTVQSIAETLDDDRSIFCVYWEQICATAATTFCMR